MPDIMKNYEAPKEQVDQKQQSQERADIQKAVHQEMNDLKQDVTQQKEGEQNPEINQQKSYSRSEIIANRLWTEKDLLSSESNVKEHLLFNLSVLGDPNESPITKQTYLNETLNLFKGNSNTPVFRKDGTRSDMSFKQFLENQIKDPKTWEFERIKFRYTREADAMGVFYKPRIAFCTFQEK